MSVVDRVQPSRSVHEELLAERWVGGSVKVVNKAF